MLSLLALSLAPTFFVMLLGYGAGKTGHINNRHVTELNTVVMSYCLPASLLVATASSKWSDLVSQWPILLSLGIVMMGIYVLWYAYQRLVRNQDSSEAALQSLAVGQPNYAAAAFPVITALFGPSNLSTIAVGIAVGSLLPSPLTLALLELDEPEHNRERGESDQCRGRAKANGLMHFGIASSRALSKPIVLAPVFGTLLSLSGWQLPGVLIACLREIGTAAGGMGLLVTGLVLSETKFRLTINTALGVAVSNIVQPVLAFIICHAVNAPLEITKLSVIMAALPSGFFGILFGNSYGRLSDEANSTIIVSTIFSALTLPVAIAWIYSLNG